MVRHGAEPGLRRYGFSVSKKIPAEKRGEYRSSNFDRDFHIDSLITR